MKKGIKVEREHTSDEAEARIIAMDHLVELPDYYTRLDKMEEEGKKDLEESSMAGVAGVISANPGDHGQPVDIDSEELKETNKQKIKKGNLFIFLICYIIIYYKNDVERNFKEVKYEIFTMQYDSNHRSSDRTTF